jgi:Arc/MetJ family transcription regulator
MTVTLQIDEELLELARTESGLKEDRDAVEEGLRLLIERSRRRQLADLFGKVAWEGDLDRLRERSPSARPEAGGG